MIRTFRVRMYQEYSGVSELAFDPEDEGIADTDENETEIRELAVELAMERWHEMYRKPVFENIIVEDLTNEG